MPCLADGGYEGAGILTPVKRPAGERGLALLTRRWAALQHVTADPRRITAMTRAALVLTTGVISGGSAVDFEAG